MYYDLTNYINKINKVIEDNSEEIILNHISIDDINNSLNKDIKTIIISPAFYSKIRTFNNFKSASTREILFKNTYGTWNNIDVTVRSMPNINAIYLSKKDIASLIQR